MKIPPISPNIQAISSASNQSPDLLYPQDSLSKTSEKSPKADVFVKNQQSSPAPDKKSLLTILGASLLHQLSLNVDLNKIYFSVAEWFKSWRRPPS